MTCRCMGCSSGDLPTKLWWRQLQLWWEVGGASLPQRAVQSCRCDRIRSDAGTLVKGLRGDNTQKSMHLDECALVACSLAAKRCWVLVSAGFHNFSRWCHTGGDKAGQADSAATTVLEPGEDSPASAFGNMDTGHTQSFALPLFFWRATHGLLCCCLRCTFKLLWEWASMAAADSPQCQACMVPTAPNLAQQHALTHSQACLSHPQLRHATQHFSRWVS